MPLNALRSFRCVAEHASFSGAAAALNVSQAAVSASVKSLEQYLGVRLFERSGREVRLSRHGEMLFHSTVPALDEIQTTLRAMRCPAAEEALLVTMLPSFATHWFLPRLRAFAAVEPRVQIQLVIDRRLVDLHAKGVHAAIRFGPGRWKGLRTQSLFGDWLLPVCTPELLGGVTPLNSMSELMALPLLETNTETWERWLVAQGMRVRCPRPALVTDDSGVLLTAVKNGLGVGLARWLLACDSIDSGALVPALRIALPEPFAYWMAWPPELESDARLANFRKWLLLQAASVRPPPFATR